MNPIVTKKNAVLLANQLCYIFNLSFEKGLYPSRLKIAIVAPVFKSGSRNDPENSANSDDKLQFLISQFLAKYQKWCLDNWIIINPKKTENIKFNVNKLIIIINNHTIIESSVVKYLGLYIDNNLNWKFHISHVTKIC